MINQSVFTSFPVIRTSRLTLRDIRPEDAESIFRMRSSGRVNQFIARDNMQEQAAAQMLVEKTIEAWKNKQAIGWAGILCDDDEIIGTCGFNTIDFDNHRAEIGGELSVEHWGTGVAVEAVRAIIDFGLTTMNLHTIEAKVSPGNRSAIFILEQMGFRKEAHYKDRIYFDGNYLDMAVYSLLNDQHSLERTCR